MFIKDYGRLSSFRTRFFSRVFLSLQKIRHSHKHHALTTEPDEKELQNQESGGDGSSPRLLFISPSLLNVASHGASQIIIIIIIVFICKRQRLMASRGRKAFGLACAAASSANGSITIRRRNLHSCLIPSSSPHSSPLPEKRTVPEYRLASIRSTVFISSQNIIAHHFSPFAARTSIFSYNRPLFLSSPSSLLLQSTTPFYCPGDASLESRLRNDAFVPNDLRLRPTKHSSIPLDRQKEGEEDIVTSGSGSSVQRGNVNAKKDVSVQQLAFLSNNEVFNWPNAISFGRLLSGPFIAWYILFWFPFLFCSSLVCKIVMHLSALSLIVIMDGERHLVKKMR